MRGAFSTSSAMFGGGARTAGMTITPARLATDLRDSQRLRVFVVIAFAEAHGTWTHFGAGLHIAATTGRRSEPAEPVSRLLQTRSAIPDRDAPRGVDSGNSTACSVTASTKSGSAVYRPEGAFRSLRHLAASFRGAILTHSFPVSLMTLSPGPGWSWEHQERPATKPDCWWDGC